MELANLSVHELTAVCKHYKLSPKSMRKDHFLAVIVEAGLSDAQIQHVLDNMPTATPSVVSARVDEVVTNAIAAAEQRIMAAIPAAAPAINVADIQREVANAVARSEEHTSELQSH